MALVTCATLEKIIDLLVELFNSVSHCHYYNTKMIASTNIEMLEASYR